MGTEFSWFYDAVTAALLLVFIYVGGKRGFIRSFIMIAGYLLSFAAAYFISDTATPVVYEKFAQDKIVSIIEDKIENINITSEVKNALDLDALGITVQDEEIRGLISSNSGDLSQDIQSFVAEKSGGTEISKSDIDEKLQSVFSNSMVTSFLDGLPASIMDAWNTYIQKSSRVVSDTLRVLNASKTDAAKFVEVNIVREPLIQAMQLLIFIVVFTFALFIVKMIARLFSGFNRVPIAGSINALLGAALGLLQGLVVVLLIALILHVLIFLSSNEMIVINTQTIDNTYLFKLFYHYDLLK